MGRRVWRPRITATRGLASALDEMYITAGGRVFKRKTKVKGILSWRAPINSVAPGL